MKGVKTKKMYFFNPSTKSPLIIILFLRMIGCLLIGQKIMGISYQSSNNQVNIYFFRDLNHNKQLR